MIAAQALSYLGFSRLFTADIWHLTVAQTLGLTIAVFAKLLGEPWRWAASSPSSPHTDRTPWFLNETQQVQHVSLPLDMWHFSEGNRYLSPFQKRIV